MGTVDRYLADERRSAAFDNTDTVSARTAAEALAWASNAAECEHLPSVATTQQELDDWRDDPTDDARLLLDSDNPALADLNLELVRLTDEQRAICDRDELNVSQSVEELHRTVEREFAELNDADARNLSVEEIHVSQQYQIALIDRLERDYGHLHKKFDIDAALKRVQAKSEPVVLRLEQTHDSVESLTGQSR